MNLLYCMNLKERVEAYFFSKGHRVANQSMHCFVINKNKYNIPNTFLNSY